MEDCIHPRRPKIFTRGPFRPHDMTLRVIKYFDSETTLISVGPSDVNSSAIASNLAQTSVYATLLSFNPRARQQHCHYFALYRYSSIYISITMMDLQFRIIDLGLLN